MLQYSIPIYVGSISDFENHAFMLTLMPGIGCQECITETVWIATDKQKHKIRQKIKILMAIKQGISIRYIEDKHNGELQQTDPGTKDMETVSTRGCIFPHNAQNRFILFPLFWLGKNTLN